MPMSPFNLDEVTNLVQRDGIAARLSEQEKRLLLLLSARAGTAWGKRALMEALWGRRAQWMEDAALVQLVSRLRRSLAPLGLERTIVTVARVGYRFDAPRADGRSHTSPARCPASGVAADGDRHDALHDGSARPDHRTDHRTDRRLDQWTNARADPGVDPRADHFATASPDHALQHCVARDGHGEVHRHGVAVRIPQIEYRLWCALHSPPGVVHDKRALIALLWPDRPDQDDTNLMQVVSRLRRRLIPLGLQRHIVTVPRRGYRFVPCNDMACAAAPVTGAREPRRLVWLRTCRRSASAWLTCLTRRLRWPGR